MMWGYGFGWGSMALMILGMTLWLLLLIALAWSLISWLNRKATLPTPPAPRTLVDGPSAMEILRQRYARGEIDTTTFDQMRERLEASGSKYQYGPQTTYTQ